MRCGIDRPKRSRRHTHKVSPGRSEASASVSWGRAALAPDATSVQVRQQPAALRASCCNAGSCPAVDTLAYQRAQRTEILLYRHVDGLILAARGVPFVLVLRRAGANPA